MAPWILTLKGTLAAVFVEQGEYQKGLEWALSVAKESEEMPSPTRDDIVGANLATAALGYFHLGERETAMHYLQQATALAPNELAIQKAAAAIQGNKTAVENYKT